MTPMEKAERAFDNNSGLSTEWPAAKAAISVYLEAIAADEESTETVARAICAADCRGDNGGTDYQCEKCDAWQNFKSDATAALKVLADRVKG